MLKRIAFTLILHCPYIGIALPISSNGNSQGQKISTKVRTKQMKYEKKLLSR